MSKSRPTKPAKKNSKRLKSVVIFLSCLVVMFSSIGLSIVVPKIAESTSAILTTPQAPVNSSQTLGIQKFIYPPLNRNQPVPEISARSALIKDLSTDTILYQKNAFARVPIASTTKIMTALVANEYFSPNSILVVGKAASIGGSRVGLSTGEQLSFRALLYGMLLNSGNDAAFAIAENYPGGVDSFVAAMNQKAQDLNLVNTHFDNPAGFDSPNHFSSAFDLALIAQESLKSSQLARIFSTKETEVFSTDKKYAHKLQNLNQLLSQTGVLGIKTGYTDAAKENLVGLVERKNKRVLTVVLGSDDRFGESSNLMEWVYSNFLWVD